MTLTELKTELKAIGYRITLTSCSFGKSATYIHVRTNEKLNFNAADKATWQKWQPLLEYLKTNKERIVSVSGDNGERIYGLRKAF